MWRTPGVYSSALVSNILSGMKRPAPPSSSSTGVVVGKLITAGDGGMVVYNGPVNAAGQKHGFGEYDVIKGPNKGAHFRGHFRDDLRLDDRVDL